MGTIFPEAVLNSAAHRNTVKGYSVLWRAKQHEFRQWWVLQMGRITADLFISDQGHLAGILPSRTRLAGGAGWWFL